MEVCIKAGVIQVVLPLATPSGRGEDPEHLVLASEPHAIWHESDGTYAKSPHHPRAATRGEVPQIS